MTSFVKRTELDWAVGTFSKLATKKGILQFGEGDDFANLLRSTYGSDNLTYRFSDTSELSVALIQGSAYLYENQLVVANPAVSLADTVVEATLRLSDLTLANWL